MNCASSSVALLGARFLQRRGVRRLFGLQGGHVQPVWDEAAQLGIDIVDVRDEGAAVHMAHAQAELTGDLGVALVTAGPGVTNTVTATANASVARVPLLIIAGCPPRPQDNMGPLQGIAHVDLMRPITRHAVTLRESGQVLRELDEAVARAFGDAGEPGPVYVEFPADVLREAVPTALVLQEYLDPKPPRVIYPDPAQVRAAVEVLWTSQRPLVISGRGARGAGPTLIRLLDRLEALYLDTQESRGLVPSEHPSQVGAMRGRVMAEADTVLLLGRKLDYQLAYGSPVAFPHARFVRISDSAAELIDNRRGVLEMLATPAVALDAILRASGSRSPAVDRSWTAALREEHAARTSRYRDALVTSPAGADGAMHPNRIFAALREVFDPAKTIAIADGGDILSFARLGLEGCMYLDSGTFGCLGVGVPYAIAAKLTYPEYDVVAVVGDGSFGFNAMEIDSAVRHGARILIVVANNAAWNIERQDQIANYGGRVVGTILRHSHYAMLAQSLGAYGERVSVPEELGPSLKRAMGNLPAVLDVIVSRDAMSSDASKGLATVPDYQALVDWDALERRRRGR
jgi:acetolactate synthase-1/2/3 large subunit